MLDRKGAVTLETSMILPGLIMVMAGLILLLAHLFIYEKEIMASHHKTLIEARDQSFEAEVAILGLSYQGAYRTSWPSLSPQTLQACLDWIRTLVDLFKGASNG